MASVVLERLKGRVGSIPRSEARALLRVAEALAEAGESAEAEGIRAIARGALGDSVGRSPGVRLGPVLGVPAASPESQVLRVSRSRGRIRTRGGGLPLAGWTSPGIAPGRADRTASIPLPWEGPARTHWDDGDPSGHGQVYGEAIAMRILRAIAPKPLGRGRRLNGSRRDRRLLTPGQSARADTWRRVCRMNGRLRRDASMESAAIDRARERAVAAALAVGVHLAL